MTVIVSGTELWNSFLLMIFSTRDLLCVCVQLSLVSGSDCVTRSVLQSRLEWFVFRTSLQYGINSLKKINYDRKELERRREESANEVKGNVTWTSIISTPVSEMLPPPTPHFSYKVQRNTQVQLGHRQAAGRLPFLDARYCKPSLNSPVASRSSQRGNLKC